MASTQYYYPTPTPTLPITMPGKKTTPPYYPHGRISGSPPERPDSVTTSNGTPSYDPSTTSSYANSSAYAGSGSAGYGSYAGSASASDYEAGAQGGAVQGVDLLEYMGERVGGAFEAARVPEGLDRGLVAQVKTSGELNAKTRELMQLQALARSRLAATQANFADGMKAAKDVQRDLEWTQKRVSSINQRAARKYPEQYKMAAQRYPAPVDY